MSSAIAINLQESWRHSTPTELRNEQWTMTVVDFSYTMPVKSDGQTTRERETTRERGTERQTERKSRKRTNDHK